MCGKGFSKNMNYLTRDKYLTMLCSRKSGSGINKNFRTDGREMFTTAGQEFLYLSIISKEKRGTDGSSTFPLDI